MLTLYDPLEDYLTELNRQKNAVELPYYASDVVDFLGLLNENDLQFAVNRALKVCLTLQIPIVEHVKTIYRFNGNALVLDWKISAFASYLITINADPANPKVAEVQLFFYNQV